MNWKRPVGFLLALVLILTSCGAGSAAEKESQRLGQLAAATFSDVSADAEYAQSVGWCYEQELMNGVADGKFDPDGTLTRAMVAAILYRAEKEPTVAGTPSFDDTEANVWYSNAVVWANEKGFLLGYGNGLFGTTDPVSVEQLEVIMGRYTGDGPAWIGIPAKAIAATRAQAAAAFYAAMKPAEPTPINRPSGGGGGGGGSVSRPSGGSSGGSSARPTPTPTPTPSPTPEPSQAPSGAHVLVAYFSAQGHTRPMAEKAAEAAGADLFEIVPTQPYTEGDLNYNTDCRANAEQNDPNARPAIANKVENMDQYDAVLIGYPIWWGRAPKIIHTFLESYDLSGKTIATFCTSGGSGHEDGTIRGYEPDATWLAGKRFTNTDQVEEWVNGLELSKQEETAMNRITLSFNGHTYAATLADNSSAVEFAQLLESKGGAMTIHMNEYGGWEKVGPLGQSLTRHDAQTTTQAGDFVLYSGNQIVLFYGSNSWSYTRLGKLDDPAGLQAALGSGDVDITFQLGEDKGDTGPFDLAAGQVTLNSGYEMPLNGLGTYSLHGEECVNAVKAALRSGVRLFDTASAYGNEQEVGQALREGMEELGLSREDIFVTTKIYPGSEMANPEASIQACLDRLDIGYVDLMLLHHPDPNDVKAYKAMEQFVTEGKIRSVGLSNWYVEELEEFLPQVSIKPALVQNEIHPYYQENDVIPFIQEQGIVVEGWYPLGGRGHTAELLGDKVISDIAAAHGVSSAQVILRWNLQKGVVVIPGSSNPDHIKENTQLYHFSLTDEEMSAIAALDRNEKHDWY